ncbi:hypothetical protein SAMN05428964_101812 [Thalassospira xiamenensis]|uniref:Uncharacterized protein n=1 Tax=Thalassospira xiamenensis TaxID=220697 RepID=A0A285RHS8_9PROT|nr:hypothetical protein SAMN05428964_101812 [Thalassospira xiamenensis]
MQDRYPHMHRDMNPQGQGHPKLQLHPRLQQQSHLHQPLKLQPPAPPQPPNPGQQFYAASCKAQPVNPARIYAAPCTASLPHAATVAAKRATRTAKTKAAAAVQIRTAAAATAKGPHLQRNPQRPNLDRPFYAASCKAHPTNPARIYAAPCNWMPASLPKTSRITS